MFEKMLSFLTENGSYILFSTVVARPVFFLRNRMLAAKFGVHKLSIGSRPYLRGLSSIAMGEDLIAGEGLWLEAITRYGNQRFEPHLTIGNHVRISHWSHIACTHSVTIGNHVLIGSKVLITDHNHGLFGPGATSPLVPPGERPLERNRSVSIGDNVWLGDGVVVCPDVTMGEGSIAAANAVVTKDVLPLTLVAGVPAVAIRRYDAAAETWISI
ncbi:O-acetyltransferase [Acidisarcina polymorpha]|uniref:O-acetyltransferase n=1 Tax=Acidisarcina polymorpha TaxID=2211140 RepID=A0A2Z5FX99_9BACT|nr:acyltransferase [Acidisarcina polymorpha]AXC11519.1 O-acetyltransferase [Acidisarcina polymorpha]